MKVYSASVASCCTRTVCNCTLFMSSRDGLNTIYCTHVAAVVLTPLTMQPHKQTEIVRSPVRGQEQGQPDVI